MRRFNGTVKFLIFAPVNEFNERLPAKLRIHPRALNATHRGDWRVTLTTVEGSWAFSVRRLGCLTLLWASQFYPQSSARYVAPGSHVIDSDLKDHARGLLWDFLVERCGGWLVLWLEHRLWTRWGVLTLHSFEPSGEQQLGEFWPWLAEQRAGRWGLVTAPERAGSLLELG